VEKAMQKNALRRCMIMVVLLLIPLMDCIASSSGEKSPALQSKSKTEAGEVISRTDSDESDCVRGEPKPVLKNSAFKPLTRSTAVEAYTLNKDIKLTIRHFGCAHFSESYHFLINKKKNSKTENDWRSWMNFAADQLDLLPVEDIVKPQIQVMASTLRDQARNTRSYVYNSEIAISETEILSFDVKPADGNSTEIIVLYQFIL
jgi:hypothetical protein